MLVSLEAGMCCWFERMIINITSSSLYGAEWMSPERIRERSGSAKSYLELQRLAARRPRASDEAGEPFADGSAAGKPASGSRLINCAISHLESGRSR